MSDTYSYMKPEARVSQSELTGHWLVDASSPVHKQGYREYDDALAEAMARTARELRDMARYYENKARTLASDPDLLPA